MPQVQLRFEGFLFRETACTIHDRFLADGGGCKMQRLGELLRDECASEEV